MEGEVGRGLKEGQRARGDEQGGEEGYVQAGLTTGVGTEDSGLNLTCRMTYRPARTTGIKKNTRWSNRRRATTPLSSSIALSCGGDRA